MNKPSTKHSFRISEKDAGLILTVLDFVLKLRGLFCLCEDELNEKELIRLRKRFRRYGEKLPIFETNNKQ